MLMFQRLQTLHQCTDCLPFLDGSGEMCDPLLSVFQSSRDSLQLPGQFGILRDGFAASRMLATAGDLFEERAVQRLRVDPIDRADIRMMCSR